eukprot:gene6232-6469_t
MSKDVSVPVTDKVRHLMFTWTLTNGIIDSVDQLEKVLAAAVCAAHPSCLQAADSWVQRLIPQLIGYNLWLNWWQVLRHELPAMLRKGSSGIKSTIASPIVQAGFKYATALTVVFVATILAIYYDPVLAGLNPAYGFVASALAMSERVEATVSFWIIGTAIGGTLGLLAMLHPALATNPFGLAAVIVAFSLVVGSFFPTQFKTLITLSLMTMTAIILCQCCQVEGNPSYAAARIVSVIGGVLFSVGLCNLLLPWYTSDWAIQVMAQTYQRCIALMLQMDVYFFSEGAAAVATFEMPCAEQQEVLGQSLDHCRGPIKHSSNETAAAADAAAALRAAADAALQKLKLVPPQPPAAAAGGGGSTAVLSCADLQALIARPLTAVQGSLIKDSVAWHKGYLATPPVVPQLLGVLLGVLDRLAALQMALSPPVISGRFTGLYMTTYGVPMQVLVVNFIDLVAELGNLAAQALLQPSEATSKAVLQLVERLSLHRVQLFRSMTRLRQQLHEQVVKEQQLEQQMCSSSTVAAGAPSDVAPACSMEGAQDATLAVADRASFCSLRRRVAMLLGGVDDVVRFMSFTFAISKAADRLIAVARLAAADVCRQRNTRWSGLK